MLGDRGFIAHLSLDAFRKAVVARFRPRLLRLNEYFTMDGDERVGWLMAHLGSIDASLIALLSQIPSKKLPGIALVVAAPRSAGKKVSGASTPEVIFERLALFQQELLVAIPPAVMVDESTSLHEEIRRLLLPGVLLPTVPERTAEKVAEISGDLPDEARYVVQAVYAFACLAANVPNPHAYQWAEDYVGFELRRRKMTDSFFERFALPPAEVVPTLEFAALWQAVNRRLIGGGLADTDLLAHLPELCADLGHRGLFHSAMGYMARSGGGPNGSVTEMVKELGPGSGESPDHRLANSFSLLAVALGTAGRLDELEKVLDALLAHHAEDPDTSLLLLARFGETCKEVRTPLRFLARVGNEPLPEEGAVSPYVQLSIGIERSNALRIVGRTRDALEVLDCLAPLAYDAATRRLLARNRALLLRRLGRPDESVTVLEAQLAGTVGGERLETLRSLIASYSALGDGDHVFAAVREAEPLAVGPWRSQRDYLTALRLGLEVIRNGDLEQITAELRGLGVPDDEESLSAAGSAWCNVAAAGQAVGETLPVQIITALASAARNARARGDGMLARVHHSIAARLAELVDDPRAEEHWRAEMELGNEVGEPEAVTLAAVARYAARCSDVAECAALLARIPAALAGTIGEGAHVGLLLDATSLLRRELAELAETLTNRPVQEDILRLIAELQRDAAGRAQLTRQVLIDAALLGEGLGEDVIGALRPGTATLHVLEWLGLARSEPIMIKTTIPAIGPCQTAAVQLPADAPLDRVARGLKARLNGWLPDHPGDPFAYDPWRRLEAATLTEMLDPDPGDHVIVIEHPRYVGVPSHAMVDAPWTVSYAPSWSSLLAARLAPAKVPASIGVVTVPGAEDDDATVAALSAAADGVQELSAQLGLRVVRLNGPNADHASLGALLATVDVAVLLCHGYVAPEDHEIALMIANGGQLPPTHAIAAGSPAGRAHRWSWRDAARLPAAPALVVSAACSSGTSHIAGLGERLGLYGAMRLRGTRAVVAPFWDLVPSDAATLITSILRLHLRDAVPLPMALRKTTRESTVPRWRGACFTVEGDWR
ncbi:CHAT domain-containing protein [Actinomadura chokoriensis]|uniref:CHAT domain-containing protein n=1 Tax=Actinomadura chokoriensis TaxID=454156 RepID=A0ABV4QSX5_9ACTN